MKQQATDYMKGRGAQVNTHNRFLKQARVQEHWEAIDELEELDGQTEYLIERPKKIVNKVSSPDIFLPYSMNPYQGCEHGCIYCYARTTHEYWGMSAGLDFERKIIVKENAAELLEAQFREPEWESAPIMLSGNTDCYQPVERKKEITRRMLEVCLRFRNPVSIITKNALILRDLDILRELAALRLVHVAISITTLEEDLRRQLEPRTVSAARRLHTLRTLTDNGIPCVVMAAPMIPGLNSAELPAILEAAAEAGAYSAGYTLVRLNGAIGTLFEDWIRKNMPDRADKVLRQIAEVHNGKLEDRRYGTRMRGEGQIAESIKALFQAAREKHFKGRTRPDYDLTIFHRPPRPGDQLGLFG